MRPVRVAKGFSIQTDSNGLSFLPLFPIMMRRISAETQSNPIAVILPGKVRILNWPAWQMKNNQLPRFLAKPFVPDNGYVYMGGQVP
jgi:hypothetical protein